MSIAIVIPEDWAPEKLIRWAATLARAKQKDLLVIRARRARMSRPRRKAKRAAGPSEEPWLETVKEHAADFVLAKQTDPCPESVKAESRPTNEPIQRRLILTDLNEEDLVEGVLGRIKDSRVVMLILPRRQGTPLGEEEFASHRRLFQEAPCEVLQLRPGAQAKEPGESVLVATNGAKQTTPALDLGLAFAGGEARPFDAIYVDKGDTTATPEAAPRKVERLVRKSLKRNSEPVVPQVVVDSDISSGVRNFAVAKGHETVIVGVGRDFADDRRQRDSVSEKLMSELGDSTIVVVRKAMPVAGRMLKSIENQKKRIVPQLDRQGRVELAQRLQSSASWDFDFVMMMFLATLLAALGLVLDSAPVVIGAMLVAPLMSPMLGLGLSVVQGNRSMANRCLATIGWGCLVAFGTGCVVGILLTLFMSGTTQQMLNRGAPGALDLVVAFVSGLVAAYAFGRPHLLSVLPGIAIASSLAPPLATAGLATIAFEFNLTLGALLLFFSNFIAIVLGSAFALWVIGMRGPREICPFAAWAQRYVFGFCAIAACLVVLLVFRGKPSELQASSIALDSEQSSRDRASEESSLKLPLASDTPVNGGAASERPLVETAEKGLDTEQTENKVAAKPLQSAPAAEQVAGTDEKVRLVFKPIIKENKETQGPVFTVELPQAKSNAKTKPNKQEDAAIDVQELAETIQKGPITRWIKERRAKKLRGQQDPGQQTKTSKPAPKKNSPPRLKATNENPPKESKP